MNDKLSHMILHWSFLQSHILFLISKQQHIVTTLFYIWKWMIFNKLLLLCTLSSMGVCCWLTHNSPFQTEDLFKNQKTAASHAIYGRWCCLRWCCRITKERELQYHNYMGRNITLVPSRNICINVVVVLGSR